MFPARYEELPIWRQCYMGLIRGLAICSVFWSAVIVYLCLTLPCLRFVFWR